ncbi:unnamed protein product [Vitrella brassicaformis CCMP3155]|uniref:Uncharacterized protein n=2 Tax=Vitrella brassicaformis TaxID=1169539 RepID=A0A0G4ETP9_VITBC|nr:unnamed protein product [Vitrella brassicaformis CCMP3155]|mmetsp:Transcript_44276/g.125241  ORF Transcript_44276/g.125241 Transcript_44276/m.125241 type:complete len:217 (-) Transcript_44276:793-1443(-)|eukprot:CEM01143.1 unnamed protein product [Vitrella brassicaformis CCMP3155]
MRRLFGWSSGGSGEAAPTSSEDDVETIPRPSQGGGAGYPQPDYSVAPYAGASANGGAGAGGRHGYAVAAHPGEGSGWGAQQTRAMQQNLAQQQLWSQSIAAWTQHIVKQTVEATSKAAQPPPVIIQNNMKAVAESLTQAPPAEPDPPAWIKLPRWARRLLKSGTFRLVLLVGGGLGIHWLREYLMQRHRRQELQRQMDTSLLSRASHYLKDVIHHL